MNTQDNFTKLPNEFVDLVLLSGKLSASEARILLFIARKTYGYGKTSDRISLSQFQKGAKVSRVTAVASLKRLEQVGLAFLVNKGNARFAISEYRVNFENYETKLQELSKMERFSLEKRASLSKNPNDSKVVNHGIPVKQGILVNHFSKEVVNHGIPTKESYTKEKLASNASKLSSWEEYGIPYLEEVGRGDDEFSARVKESYLRDGKYATKNAVLGFIDRELKSRPPEEYVNITELIEGKEGRRG